MNLLNRNVELKKTTINFDTDDELVSLCNTSDRVIVAIGGKPKELPLETRLYFAGVFNLDELNENVWGTLPENVCIIGTSHSAASVLMKITENGVCPAVKNIYMVGRSGWKFLEDDSHDGIKGPSGDFIRMIGLKDNEHIVVNGKNVYSCNNKCGMWPPVDCIAINATGFEGRLSKDRTRCNKLEYNIDSVGLVLTPSNINLMEFAKE